MTDAAAASDTACHDLGSTAHVTRRNMWRRGEVIAVATIGFGLLLWLADRRGTYNVRYAQTSVERWRRSSVWYSR